MTEEPSRKKLLEKIQSLEAKLANTRTGGNSEVPARSLHSRIVQGFPIAAFVIDTAHKVAGCNSAFEKLTGIRADKMIGTENQWNIFYYKKRPTLADLVLDKAPEETIARYYVDLLKKSDVIEGGYEAESYFPALAGGGKWIYFTAAPIKDDQNRLIGAIETLQDITERKLAENRLIESERRLSVFFEFMPYPIVTFTRRGRVYYLNPAFTDTFGWRLDELKGRPIPWDPPGLEGLPDESMETFFGVAGPRRFETKRLTKDGRIIDVIARAVSYSSAHGKAGGVLMVQRDVTKERREARNNESIHKISLALPAYPDLKDLLDFITDEVRKLTGSEVANILLYDRERNEMIFLVIAHEDRNIQKNTSEVRVPMEKLVSRHVIESGNPFIENDLSTYGDIFNERDEKLGYQTKNVAMVPLKSGDRTIGILAAANKKIGVYEDSDIELLNTIGSTVALSIENARFAEELQKAYVEVKSLNRAKDKVINHLSHELKTPAAVLAGSISILAKQLEKLPDRKWQSTLDRVNRNLNRIVEIQNEVSDIVLTEGYDIRPLLSVLLEQCADIIETFIATENDDENAVEALRKRIDDVFDIREMDDAIIQLSACVESRLEKLTQQFSHRIVRIQTELEPGIEIRIPEEVLNKVVDGLVRNAVENTPDRGTVNIGVYKKGKGAVLSIADSGVGIRKDSQRRVFEGFFTTRDTMAYSSKRPFDFNAGGKGADLLRMKIFSERYDFKIEMTSTRCAFIPDEKDICPGDIGQCPHCNSEADCMESGGTEFTVFFKTL